MGRHLFAVILTLIFWAPERAQAQSMREFVMSCSYGVLAGTMVGAATLAFTDKPGDNLNKVARGASLGLYAGMILGAFVVYGVSDDQPDYDSLALNAQGFGPSKPKVATVARRELPRLLVAPMLSDKGLEGATLKYNVLRF